MQLDIQEIAKLRRGERLNIDVPEIGDQCVVMRSIDLAQLLHAAQDGDVVPDHRPIANLDRQLDKVLGSHPPRTVKGRLDPKTRVRKLDVIDLWEISIVTFPLLPGARVRAVKEARLPPPPTAVRTRGSCWCPIRSTKK